MYYVQDNVHRCYIITLSSWLYVRFDILLVSVKHLHDRITSLRGKVWAHQTSLTPSLFIEVPVPSQESERSRICVLGVSILPVSEIFYWVWEMFRQKYLVQDNRIFSCQANYQCIIPL
jgi:hypothetical protein